LSKEEAKPAKPNSRGTFAAQSIRPLSFEYHLLVAHDLKAISTKHYAKLTAQTIEVRKMLYGLLDCINERKAGKKQPDKKSRPQDESLS
jgi:hypothetical protein